MKTIITTIVLAAIAFTSAAQAQDVKHQPKHHQVQVAAVSPEEAELQAYVSAPVIITRVAPAVELPAGMTMVEYNDMLMDKAIAMLKDMPLPDINAPLTKAQKEWAAAHKNDKTNEAWPSAPSIQGYTAPDTSVSVGGNNGLTF